jgi:hypothetical protein
MTMMLVSGPLHMSTAMSDGLTAANDRLYYSPTTDVFDSIPP